MASPVFHLIINQGRVAGEDLLGLVIQDVRHFVDLKLMAALLAAHPHPPAGAGHLKFSLALFTFHFFAVV